MNEESKFSFKLPRYADLLMDTYIVLNLPTIWSPIYPPQSTSTKWRPYEFKWIKNIGSQIIHEVTFTIGGRIIQKFSGSYLQNIVERDFDSNKKDSLRILEQITEASIDYAKNQVNSGIDVFQLFETYCGAIPYELYEELILPFSKKILNSVKEMNCPNIFFPKDFSLGLKSINKGICDFVSIDWHISLNSAR